jgi:LmbE family N-acetylglucosaminyl deacetylase
MLKKKILIVVSHPDDEILGCGGSIAKFVKEGHDVAVIFTHEGSTARYNNKNYKEARLKIKSREVMATKVAKMLKFKILKFGKNHNLDNRNFDMLQNTKILIKLIEKFKPDILFTHHSDDINEDHRYTFQTVINASRPVSKHIIEKILLMEIPSSTDWNIKNNFKPNFFIPIDNFFKKKLKAFKIYKSENKSFPHSRSFINLDAQSKYRGAQVGIAQAEAFELYRHIEK